ncbi:MAG: amidohydrolase family protein [Gaiellaceae bacterium]
MEALERARQLLDEFAATARAELPVGSRLFDVHTHLGNDIDGMAGRYDELTAMLATHGFDGAFVFCMDEHDREPGFQGPNDRTLAFAERAGGALIPFVRLDLGAEPLAEAVRCLDLGARGIKLHPRAQKFSVDDERLEPIFALAVDRDVPILIHGGRGLPPIADHLATLVGRHAGVRLIIAHAGIADLAGLAGRFAGVPGVYFDTSVWSAIDLLDLLRQVSPEQVLYASDYPYGRQPNSLLLTLRATRASGYDDGALRLVLGESAFCIVRREPQPALTEPVGLTTLSQPMTFARIHQYLSMATPLFWLRQGDAIGALGLAINAAQEENGFAELSAQIHELLVTAQELWTASREIDDEVERNTVGRTAFGLVHLSDMLAVTAHA